jgi:hypothetical protein
MRLRLQRCGEASPVLQALPSDKELYGVRGPKYAQYIALRERRPVVVTLERDHDIVHSVEAFNLGALLQAADAQGGFCFSTPRHIAC